MLRYLIVCAWLIAMLSPLHAETMLRLQRVDLECLKEHVDAYRASEEEPLIIFLPSCPIVDLSEALSAQARASETSEQQPESGASIFRRDAVTSDEQRVDAMVEVTRRELDCLVTLVDRSDDDVIVVPRSAICAN